MSLRLRYPRAKWEKAATADDRHLPHRREHRVPPQRLRALQLYLPSTKASSLPLTNQQRLALRMRKSPCAFPTSLEFRSGSRQRVINHHDSAETSLGFVRQGCTGDPDSSGISSADDVVEVEVKMAEFLSFEAEVFGRQTV
ncbi:hypothetical protein V6Z11_D07G099100 [Gossypium hirsutum]